MDSLIDATVETLLCREVYAARIRSAMPHGQMQHVARRAEISRQFFHRILVVDDGGGSGVAQAWPSADTAARVAEALAVEEGEAAEALYWMRRALSAREQGGAPSPRRRCGLNVAAAADDICELMREAVEIPCPEAGRAACRLVAEQGAALIEKADSRDHAKVVVEVSLWVNEALGRLGDHARALYYARRAEYVLELSDGARWRSDWRRVAELRVSVSRAVSAAYAALGLVRQAMKALVISRQWARKSALLENWLPRLNCTEILVWAGLKRFALRRIQELHEQAIASGRESGSADVVGLRLRAAEGYLAHAVAQSVRGGVLAAGRELEALRSVDRGALGWAERAALAEIQGRWVRMAATIGSVVRDNIDGGQEAALAKRQAGVG